MPQVTFGEVSVGVVETCGVEVSTKGGESVVEMVKIVQEKINMLDVAVVALDNILTRALGMK